MRQLKITKQVTNRETASLDKYLQEIGRVDLITAEEEVELARRIKAGDQAALEKLTKANLRFVVSVSKQYQNQGLSLPDLINEGNLGLIKAAQRFDETRGFKFISYAVWWIRQSILQALAEQSRIVRLPLNKIGSINKINKAFAKLEQEFERPPTAAELAEMLDMTLDEVKQSMKNSGRHVSMDAPLKDGDDSSSTMYDVMRTGDSPAPDTDLMNESLRKEIERSLRTLTPREGDVIRLYFGLNGEHPMTLEEIGERFDLTRERVRQIKEKAIRRLKHTSRSRILKSYLGYQQRPISSTDCICRYVALRYDFHFGGVYHASCQAPQSPRRHHRSGPGFSRKRPGKFVPYQCRRHSGARGGKIADCGRGQCLGVHRSHRRPYRCRFAVCGRRPPHR